MGGLGAGPIRVPNGRPPAFAIGQSVVSSIRKRRSAQRAAKGRKGPQRAARAGSQPSGTGSSVSRGDFVGAGSFSFFSILRKQLWPARRQRSISAVMLLSRNVGRYTRSDSSTLTIIDCRRAPTVDLFARPVSRV